MGHAMFTRGLQKNHHSLQKKKRKACASNTCTRDYKSTHFFYALSSSIGSFFLLFLTKIPNKKIASSSIGKQSSQSIGKKIKSPYDKNKLMDSTSNQVMSVHKIKFAFLKKILSSFPSYSSSFVVLIKI
jgi:hypothetical protein